MLRRFALNTVPLPPSIHAALVDSLFSNPAPMFFGALCSAIAAVLTIIVVVIGGWFASRKPRE